MNRCLLIAAITLANCIANEAVADDLATATGIVEVDGGKVSGIRDGDVANYRGIPFAAPPVGDLRWKAPQPAAGWSGVRKCDTFGPICPQPVYPAGSFYAAAKPQPQDEDCLFLNVWTPDIQPEEQLPVMVWIHGGAWTRGSGSTPTYNGAALARRGAVVVTVNYRLGPLGFLAHPELSQESERGVSGNYGILDQIAALQWVQRNIARFGGDPNRVTVFGESAGSWSVNVLVATPLANGLIHRAIGQSGTRFRSSTYLNADPDGGKTAEQEGVQYAEALEADSIAQLRELPAAELLKARFATHETVDGWALPDTVENIFAAGDHNRIPTLVGSNANEMTTLTNPASVPSSEAAVTKALTRRLSEEHVAEWKKVYAVVDDATAKQGFLDFSGDQAFAAGMRQWARYCTRAGNRAFLYYFTRVPPGPGSEYRGAYHAAEIAYAFDNIRVSDRIPYAEADNALSDTIAGYWVNFARSGDPNGGDLPPWPAYNEQDEPYIDLGDTVEAKQHLAQQRLDFLESIQASN